MFFDFIKDRLCEMKRARALPGINSWAGALAHGVAERKKLGLQGFHAVDFEWFKANFGQRAGLGWADGKPGGILAVIIE